MTHAAPRFRYDHIHLRARDPAAMARFFIEFFGAEARPEGRSDRYELTLDGQRLLVAPANPDFPAAPAPGFPHLGLEHVGLAVDDVDAACAHLRALGADIPIGPLAAGPFRLAFVRGPEGVMVELLQRPA
jgi:catechol 2,3-dioxygenase-like lactoylglutathione lyase family enzyme